MGSQLQTIMAPDDEAAFLAFAFARPSVFLIPGERNPTPEVPRTRDMRGVTGMICHLWDATLVPTLKVDYIPACQDYYLRSDGLIQFLRSPRRGDTLAAGRIALGGVPARGKAIVAWYKRLERWLKSHFENTFVYASDFKPGVGSRERTVWVGPHAIALSRQGVSLKLLGPSEFSLRYFDPAEEAAVLARYRPPQNHVVVGTVLAAGEVVDAQLRKRRYRVAFTGEAPVPELEGPFRCARPEPEVGDVVACVLGENIFGRHPDPWEPREIRKLSPKNHDRILAGLRKAWRVGGDSPLPG